MFLLFIFSGFNDVFVRVDSFRVPLKGPESVVLTLSKDGKYIVGYNPLDDDIHIIKGEKYLRLLAKKGSAPEEIQGSIWDVCVSKDKVYVAQEHGRLSVFDLKGGKVIWSRFLKSAHYPRFINVNEDGIIGLSTYEGEIIRNTVVQNELISLYNRKGKLIRRIFKPPQRYIRFEEPMFYHILPFCIVNDTIYIFGTLWQEMWAYNLNGRKILHRRFRTKGFKPPPEWNEKKMVNLNQEERSRKTDGWFSQWTPLHRIYYIGNHKFVLEYIVGGDLGGEEPDSFYYPILSSKGRILKDGLYSKERLIGVINDGRAFFRSHDSKWIKIYRINYGGIK